MQILPLIRGRDRHGAGYYGAGRGSRTHRGIDCVSNCDSTDILAPGDPVRAATSGRVTKVGYPYASDLSYRYVEITDDRGFQVRHFYVEPSVQLDDDVDQGEMIGALQALPYDGIVQHWHLEVKRRGEYFDPIRYLCGDLR